MVRTERESDGRRREEKWQTCWCCRDQQRACRMAQASAEKLANILVGYYEEKLFSQTQKPPTYLRYVDDTLAIFDHEAEAEEFLTKLNYLRPSLKFTFEKEKCLQSF